MLKYLKGDVTNPICTPAVILHGCNDIGLFGAGIAAAIAKKWPQAQQAYFDWHKSTFLAQGAIRFIMVRPENFQTEGIWICHAIIQAGVFDPDNPKPFKLSSLEKALKRLKFTLDAVQNLGKFKLSVHMGRVGMGLGKWEDWTAIEALLVEHLADYDVFVYDYA